MKKNKNNFTLFENSIMLREYSYDSAFGYFNKASIGGIIAEEFSLGHANKYQDFYITNVQVDRRNGVKDYVPVVVTKELFNKFPKRSVKGLYVEIRGEFRSYLEWSRAGNRSKLKVFLFAKKIKYKKIEEKSDKLPNVNEVFLRGIINKKPVFMEQDSGLKRTYFMLKVRREKNKTDVIPCIAWRENAQAIAKLNVGDEIQLFGRIQSREYLKRTDPNSEEGEIKMAYEVYVYKFSE